MPFFIPFLIIGALIGGAAIVAASADDDDAPPEDWIAFVGPTSAGKSRLANDVLGEEAFTVGAEHGTTTEADAIPYKNGWSLVDTPGVLDGDELAEIAANTARRSKIIVVCVDGEMYRQTFEWLEALLQSIKHGEPVVVVPCLTKSDLRETMMPERDRLKISSRLNAQIQELRSIGDDRNIRVTNLQEGSIGRRGDIIMEIQQSMDWLTH